MVMKEKVIKLSPDEFAIKCWNDAISYKEAVLNGDIVACEWIKLAVKRSNKDHTRNDLIYDKEEVTRVFKFFSHLNIPKKGFRKPAQFILSPFQAWILSEIFGWFYKEDNSRRYRDVIFFVARKAGKSMFAMGISEYCLMADKVYAPEIYFAANSREQASQMLRYAQDIAKSSPSLAERIDIGAYNLRYKGGILKTVATTPHKLDGLKPALTVLDEYHEAPTDDMYSIFKTGMMASDKPIMFITSTAGFHKEYPFYNVIELGKRVLRGEVDNDRTFYALYTMDEGDDINDPKNWIKSNPNLGVTITYKDFESDYEKAKLTPSEYIKFQVKNLNMYSDSENTWIPDEDYKKCFKPVNLEDYYGSQIYLAVDLSATRDLAALSCVIDDGTGHLKAHVDFFFPNNPNKKLRPSGIDLQRWIDSGWISEHKTKTIDYDSIIARIEWYINNFNVYGLGYDDWNSSYIITKIEELGVDVYNCPQNAKFFNEPLKYLEKSIFEQTIDMSINPVLRWNFMNIVLYTDTNGNIKISKNKKADSVDGAVAIGMSLGLLLQLQYELNN